MLTIIIFTNGRYTYVFSLLKDLLEAELNINYIIVDYKAKNQGQIIKNLIKLEKNKKKQNNIKLNLKKNKKIKLIVDKNKISFSKRFLKYIKIVKSKYVWFIGDDDRIETSYLKKLFFHIKKNKNSGFTLNHHSFKKDQEIIKKYNIKKKIIIKKFNIEKDVSKIGMISTQIINTYNLKKIFKLLDKKTLLNNGYPQVYIIMKLVEKFNDWIYISNKIVFYRYGNFNYEKKNLIERLNFELAGYYQPAKKIYGINSIIYKKIFVQIFFLYIISWVAVSLNKIKKQDIIKLIKKKNFLFPNLWHINFTLFIIYKFPNKICFYILKIIQKLFQLKVNY